MSIMFKKKPSRLLFLSLGVSALSLAPPALAQDASLQQVPESTDAMQSDEIVVTAQKRNESLQDVPISISVLGGARLDKSTVELTEQLARVPGVATVGNSFGSTVSIRGVGPALAVFAGSSPIAYYLDSVPFGFVKTAVVPDSGAYDLDRVEVLRGPQGTLYGASASNGVVRILTRDANLDKFELSGRAAILSTKNGEESYRTDTAINIPLVDGKLAVRGVLSYNNNGGWIDRPNRANANDGDVLTARLKLNAQPTDALSIGASVWISRSDFYAPPFSPNGLTAPSSAEDYVVADYDVYGLKVAYDFPTFTVSSATGYIDYRNRSFLDGPTRSLPTTAFNQLYAKTFSEELNIVSTGDGPWRWSVGAIYRSGRDGSNQRISNNPANFTLAYTSKSYAVFGELTRLFADGQFEITGGVRYFHDKVTATEVSDPFARTPLIGTYFRGSFDATSPRVVLAWHPSKAFNLYTSYVEGFRSGAPQSSFVFRAGGLAPAKPDVLQNFEAGMKGDLGSVTYDVAVYYTNWKDVQQSIILGPPQVPIAFLAIVNGPAANGMGVDASLDAEIAKGLKVGLSASWNDLRLTGPVFSFGQPVFAKGDRLNYSPEYTLGASLDYDFDLGGGYTGALSGSVNYTAATEVRGINLYRKAESQTLGRASFSISAPEHWTASLFVENITNEQGVASITEIGNRNTDIRPRPRTIGAQLQFRY